MEQRQSLTSEGGGESTSRRTEPQWHEASSIPLPRLPSSIRARTLCTIAHFARLLEPLLTEVRGRSILRIASRLGRATSGAVLPRWHRDGLPCSVSLPWTGRGRDDLAPLDDEADALGVEQDGRIGQRVPVEDEEGGDGAAIDAAHVPQAP